MAEYIERESIKKSINLLLDMVLKFTHSPIEIKQLVFDAIDEERAADVQPVNRGRWSECYTDSHHYSGICSVCGRASIKSLTESLYEYCPKCGARMDLNEGDAE